MGCRKAVLALKSSQYQVCGDIVNEFKSRHRLYETASASQLGCGFLHRYLAIAVDAGMFDMAADIAGRFGDMLDTEVADFIVSLNKTNPAMIDISGWDFKDLAGLWSVAGRAIDMQLIIEKGNPLPVPASDDLIDQIGQHILKESVNCQVVKESLFGRDGFSDGKLLVFDAAVSSSDLISIYPALLHNDSSLTFILSAKVKAADSDDISNHNITVAKTLNEFKGRLFEIINDKLLKKIHIAINKTLNERSTERCQKIAV
jgi:hypothetical protein